MNNFRLLPVLLVAASALLVLKVFGLVSDGRYSLTGTEFAFAQVTAALTPEVELSDAEEAAARRAADSLFADTAGIGAEQAEEPSIITEDSQGEVVPLASIDENAVTERAVLERLSARRIELDAIEAELAIRSDLVAAAEVRIESRMKVLEELEGRVNSLMDQYDALADEQFSSLVGMYENMKSTDAAKVFDRLETEVLLRLATNMSSRKMSAILADMDAQRAQELTIALASMSIDEPKPEQIAQTDVLPQIVGE